MRLRQSFSRPPYFRERRARIEADRPAIYVAEMSQLRYAMPAASHITLIRHAAITICHFRHSAFTSATLFSPTVALIFSPPTAGCCCHCLAAFRYFHFDFFIILRQKAASAFHYFLAATFSAAGFRYFFSRLRFSAAIFATFAESQLPPLAALAIAAAEPPLTPDVNTPPL
jgi:hypothetical protein